MDKIRHFLFLIYKNFKIPVCYCVLISIALVFYLNFCINQFFDLNHRLKVLDEFDYSKIYSVTFVRPKDSDYLQIIKDLNTKLENKANVLNFQRNYLYSTIDKKHIVTIRTISKEEASMYHIFGHNDTANNSYTAIVSNDLKNKFKAGKSYNIPIGIYVNNTTQKIKINISSSNNDLLIFSPSYGYLQQPVEEILIYDPDNTLPVHQIPSINHVFHVYMYMTDYESAIDELGNFNFIKIEKVQDSIDDFTALKLTLLPSYLRFTILAIIIYFILYMNLYILFYYKKKKYVIAFNICNLNRKFYCLCIAAANMIQLLTGFIFGQLLWRIYCHFNQILYAHNESYIFVILFIFHFCAFIILSGRYSYIVRTYN